MTLKVVALLIRQDGGGAERSVQRVRHAIGHFGVDLAPVALDPPRDGESRELGIALSSAHHGKVWALVSGAWRLRSLLVRESPDVLHLHCERPEFVGMVVALTIRSRPVIVVTEHSRQQWSRAPVVGRIVRRVLVELGATFVKCHSVDGDASALVIFNPIETEIDVLPAVPAQALPRLVVVGRLVPAKRVPLILQAAADAGWSGRIVVVGDGPERVKCEELARSLDLSADFLGFLTRPWSGIRASDAFVSASAFEGEPLTLVEAVGRGLPIVLSNIEGHRALIGGSGSYFESREDLSVHISKIQEEGVSDFRISDDLRDRILGERSPDRVARQWFELYASLVERRERALADGQCWRGMR